MKATQANFQTLLNGARQFIIPIYQRTYSWTLKQCDQLWRDIVRAGNAPQDTGHFIGSLVYIEKGIYQVSAIPELLIIDGQQRLTTISLLLLGLRQALRQKAGLATVTPDEITDYYLVNTHGKGDQHYKLLLTQNDKSTLINLVEGLNPPQDPSRRILDNFDFFTQQLQNPGVDLETVYKGICRLIIVDISLDRSNDNPQLIFESLNSTGLALSHSDYFVLMGLDRTRQEVLYKTTGIRWNRVLVRQIMLPCSTVSCATI